MPTLRENIAYHLRRFYKLNEAAIKHILRCIAVVLAIALFLETVVFNINFYATAGLDTINLKSKIDLHEGKDDVFRFASMDHEVEFTDLNTHISNIKVDFSHDQPAQLLTLKIQFTDDAHSTYFDSTEYTEGVPLVEVSTMSDQSKFINLNTTGAVRNLKISLVGDDIQYPVRLNTIYLNAHHPFHFNAVRFFAVLSVVSLICLFRPSSFIYRMRMRENPVRSRIGVVAVVVIECVLCATFLFYGSNMVGVATSSYNYGEWDGTSLVNSFEVGGDNAQQYAELAKSMAQGKLYLEEEPPEWLKAMDNPYDKGMRDEAQKETGEGYLFDVAYYDGHYYVYFGVVPVLLFYLPFYLLTGSPFPTALGVLIACLLFICGASALLDRFARHHFDRVTLGIYLVVQIAFVSSCGMLYLLKFPTFYSLPIACGLMFSVWGLYFWMCGRGSSKRYLFFALGSLCMALVAGCRPQLLLLSLLAFPLFWRPYISKRRILTREGFTEFLCLIGPYLVVAAGIMLYNHARFGSFTDFGANYNLTVNDMTQRGWVLGRIAPALFAYFFQPPDMVGAFPYLQPAGFATTYLGQTIKEATFGGIFWCYPVLWVLFFLRPLVSLRDSQRATRTITGTIFVLLFSGVAIAVVDAEMAGILQRYYADFSFMFLAAVVLLVFIANENIDDLPLARKGSGHPGSTRKSKEVLRVPALRSLLTKTLLVLVALGVGYSLLLCLTPETGWYSDIYPWAYHDLVEAIQFWT